MTEIPEHLLRRSRERREALGLSQPGAPAGEAAPAATPAVAEQAAAPAPAAAAAAPAPAAAPPPPPPPKPDPPYVAAAKNRRRIPWWAMPVLAGLPVWAGVYALTLEPTEGGAADPLALGEEIYLACASCHGATGGGGAGPAFTDGQVTATWPNWQDQVAWVGLGSADWPHETYGAPERPVKGGMPGWANQLTPEEIALVVRYEREVLGGGEPEPELVALTDAIAADAPETAEGTDVAATLDESLQPGDGPGGTRPPPDGG